MVFFKKGLTNRLVNSRIKRRKSRMSSTLFGYTATRVAFFIAIASNETVDDGLFKNIQVIEV